VLQSLKSVEMVGNLNTLQGCQVSEIEMSETIRGARKIMAQGLEALTLLA